MDGGACYKEEKKREENSFMKLIDNRYHQKSRTSLVSSSDGGILAEGETSSETSRGSEDSPPCDLGLVERLLLTHPVWFLPGIQRSGAVHFLQGKEEGMNKQLLLLMLSLLVAKGHVEVNCRKTRVGKLKE
uniref:Uncharacterized protein n=1 Tax=Glossina austeni TaxID=7395 RepID=A0A1A9VRV9_GLOAU